MDMHAAHMYLMYMRATDAIYMRATDAVYVQSARDVLSSGTGCGGRPGGTGSGLGSDIPARAVA